MRAPAALLATTLLAAAPLGACGGQYEPARTASTPAPERAAPPAAPPRPAGLPADVQLDLVGRGATGVYVLRRRAARRPRALVLFFHGVTDVEPSNYVPWLTHLVRGGSTVLYPVYQGERLETSITNALAGLRPALRGLGAGGVPVIAAGFSLGGALAVDYAASARAAGLPVPRAIFSVYPGRGFAGGPAVIPAVDAGRIAPATRLLVLASRGDAVVGTRWARRLVREADRLAPRRRTLRYVRTAGLTDHLAPQRSSAAARRAFWRPLDRLMRGKGFSSPGKG